MGKRDRKEKGFDRKGGERIGRLDEHTLSYYRRISHSLQEGFEDDEEKGKSSFETWIILLSPT